MSDANPKVLALVERALKKTPDLASTELQARAAKVDASVAELSGRQFHARYTLPVRRRMPGSGSSKRRKRGGKKRKARSAPRRSAAANPALTLLTDVYQQRRAALEEAIDAAFERAIKSDSVNQVNDLLSWIETQSDSLGARS